MLRRRRFLAFLDGLLGLLRSSEMAFGLLLALAIGVAAGLGALFFIWLAGAFRWLVFELGGLAAGLPGGYYFIVAPALGGLAVGLLIHRFAPGYRGHGVPDVMLAVAARGGRLSPRIIATRTFASAICLGSGGSVGRVGPIIQLGAGLGSALGQAFRLSDDWLRLLVACGAAAGVAACFNAPIAGVFFALEVILGEFGSRSFSLVVLSSVTAAIITRALVGNAPAFVIPSYSLVDPAEIALYFGLGVLCALVAVAYMRVFYRLWDVFDAWRAPAFVKPAGGGLLVGAIGFAFPQILDGGFDGIEAALHGSLPFQLMLALVFLKMIATGLSLGSGGSGGVFAPTLFVGAMLGGAYGGVVHSLWPGATATSGAYALVGMGALFGAAANAPITAILIVFEMTNDYRIILPLMACTGVSVLLSARLEPESIYTLKLKRAGIDVRARVQANLMQAIRVGDAMTTDFQTVPADLPLPDLVDRLGSTHQRGLPVLDDRGELWGVVTLTDVERALAQRKIASTAGEIATTNVIVVRPDDTLHEALSKSADVDAGYLPVVDPARPRRVIGLLRRADILGAYGRALARQTDLALQLERLQVESPAGACFVEVDVGQGSPLAGVAVGDLSLPRECLLVSLRRGGRVEVPHGDTVIQQGDRVVAFCARRLAADLKEYLERGELPAGDAGGPPLASR